VGLGKKEGKQGHYKDGNICVPTHNRPMKDPEKRTKSPKRFTEFHHKPAGGTMRGTGFSFMILFYNERTARGFGSERNVGQV